MKYVMFLILIAVGALMVVRTEWFFNFFGRISWAERTFGFYGGSRLFYKMLGVVIIILSAMMVTGWLEAIIVGIFSPMGGR